MIEGWRVQENMFKFNKTGMYPIAYLANPYNCATAILCRLYGLPNNARFSIEWIPFIDTYVNSHIMNWATILSNNLATVIFEYR